MNRPDYVAAQDRGCLSEQAPDTVSGGGTPERGSDRSVTTASPRSFEPAPPPPPDSKTPKRPRSSAASPSPPYRTIVADPPWEYFEGGGFPSNVGGRWTSGTAKRVYKPLPFESLTLPQIIGLPVRELADSQCRLFLWATNKYLRPAFDVVAAWGFKYAQTLIWHKTGNPTPFPTSVAPNHAEFILVGNKGNPPVLSPLASNVLSIDTNPAVLRHSQKPEAFLDYFEAISPGPYLELFARRQRLGWDTWGDEALNHVEMSA